MRNLLKSDLTRIFKDKLLLIICIVGAAFAHNFGLAGSAAKLAEDGSYSAGGVALAGKIAVGIGFAVLLLISIVNILKKKEAAKA